MKKLFSLLFFLAAVLFFSSNPPRLRASDQRNIASQIMVNYYDGKIDNLKNIKSGQIQNLVKIDYRQLTQDLVANPDAVLSNCLKKFCMNYVGENILDLPKEKQAAAQEAVLGALEILAAGAAAPIKLLLTMNEVVHGYTRGMLNFYLNKRHTDFNNEVLTPAGEAGTSAELTKLYYNFMENHPEVENGTNTLGDKDGVRKDLEATYKQALRAMQEKERKMAEAEAAKNAVVRAIKQSQWEVKVKILNAENFLKMARMPLTDANIIKYVENSAFASEIEQKGYAETEKNPPASPSTPFEKATALKLQFRKPLAQSPDYSPISRDYGLNSDRLLTNNVTPTEYNDVKNALTSAASALNNSCHEAVAQAKATTEAGNLKLLCEQTYKKYLSETEKIDANLSQYGDNLKKSLEELTMGGAFSYSGASAKANTPLSSSYSALQAELAASPAGKKLESAESLLYAVSIENSNESCAHYLKYGYNSTIPAELDGLGGWKSHAEGSTGRSWEQEMLSLEKMRENREVFKGAAGVYTAVIQFSESKEPAFAEKVTAFDSTFNRNSAKYAELYRQNSALAELFGIKYYGFETQIKELDGAKKALNNAGGLLSRAYRAKMTVNRDTALKEAAAWSESIKANESALAENDNSPAAVAELNKWTLDGTPVKLSGDFLPLYYDKNYKDFIVDFLQGALVLLDGKVRGCTGLQQAEYASFGAGSKAVLEIAKTGANISLADHTKKLEEFGKKLEELKNLDLEGRREKARELQRKFEASLAKIPAKSVETIGLGLRIMDAVYAMSWGAPLTGERFQLYYGERILSQKLLQAEYDLYAGRITKAQDYETERIDTYRRVDEAGTFTPSNWPQELSEIICWKDKWKPSNAAASAWGSLVRNRNEKQAKAFYKNLPFSAVAVAGKKVSSGYSAYNLAKTDLMDGKVVIRGDLHKDAPAFTSVAITLQAGGQKILTPVNGGTFEYSFTPEPDKTYRIKIQAEMAGFSSAPLPYGTDTVDVKLDDDRSQEVRDFYERFKSAYEGRNTPQVMSLISEAWTAGDGTALSDLDENLRNNFRLYDEIRYAMSGLKITKTGAKYQACYDVAITSRIFKRNLKHEEKSQVCEELSAEDGGKFRISRTFSGNYWYVK